MMEPDPSRPASSTEGQFASSIPPSPRVSVSSRKRLSQSPQPQNAAEAAPSPAPSSSQPSVFSPLFAIVNTANTRTSHHPTMHYIFADDDPEILTAALTRHHRDANDSGNDGQDDEHGAAGRYQQASGERAVMLDVTPAPDHDTGFKVAWASSLTPDWAVLSARISCMEGDVAGRRNDGSEALMLRVEGVRTHAETAALPDGDSLSLGGSESGSGSGSGPPPEQTFDYATLVQDFEKRMSVLRRVVETGDERERGIADEHEPEGPRGNTDPSPSGLLHQDGV